MSALAQRGDLVTLAVKVKPRAKHNRVRVEGDVVTVEVTAPPVEGAANAAVTATVAEALGLKPRQVSLLSGDSSRQKVLAIEGCALEELAARLAALQ
ncbi:MAG: DUF167 domain-containing protein [bacterium]